MSALSSCRVSRFYTAGVIRFVLNETAGMSNLDAALWAARLRSFNVTGARCAIEELHNVGTSERTRRVIAFDELPSLRGGGRRQQQNPSPDMIVALCRNICRLATLPVLMSGTNATVVNLIACAQSSRGGDVAQPWARVVCGLSAFTPAEDQERVMMLLPQWLRCILCTGNPWIAGKVISIAADGMREGGSEVAVFEAVRSVGATIAAIKGRGGDSWMKGQVLMHAPSARFNEVDVGVIHGHFARLCRAVPVREPVGKGKRGEEGGGGIGAAIARPDAVRHGALHVGPDEFAVMLAAGTLQVNEKVWKPMSFFASTSEDPLLQLVLGGCERFHPLSDTRGHAQTVAAILEKIPDLAIVHSNPVAAVRAPYTLLENIACTSMIMASRIGPTGMNCVRFSALLWRELQQQAYDVPVVEVRFSIPDDKLRWRTNEQESGDRVMKFLRAQQIPLLSNDSWPDGLVAGLTEVPFGTARRVRNEEETDIVGRKTHGKHPSSYCRAKLTSSSPSSLSLCVVAAAFFFLQSNVSSPLARHKVRSGVHFCVLFWRGRRRFGQNKKLVLLTFQRFFFRADSATPIKTFFLLPPLSAAKRLVLKGESKLRVDRLTGPEVDTIISKNVEAPVVFIFCLGVVEKCEYQSDHDGVAVLKAVHDFREKKLYLLPVAPQRPIPDVVKKVVVMFLCEIPASRAELGSGL